MADVFRLIGSANYAATVTVFDPARVVPLAGRTKVVGYDADGYQGIIGKKDHAAGDLIVIIPAGAQVSEQFARTNNLHRESALNADPKVTGYLEANRRLKAITVGGHRSDALIVPVDFLVGLDPAASEQQVRSVAPGTVFDHIGTTEVLRKFVPATKGKTTTAPSGALRFTVRNFPEHPETGIYERSRNKFSPLDHVIVSQKLHGTSVRIGNLPFVRSLSPAERIARKLGVAVPDTKYRTVVGTRRFVVSFDGKGDDLWTEATRHLVGRIPKNMVLYGEIIGWNPYTHEPIQAGYTYHVPEGHTLFLLYGATIMLDGQGYPLSFAQVRALAERLNIPTVPVLVSGTWTQVGDVKRFVSARLHEQGHTAALPLSHPDLPDEGVCLRVETADRHFVVKARSPEFMAYESANVDAGVPDIEAEQETH